jgi:hypothetical protein
LYAAAYAANNRATKRNKEATMPERINSTGTARKIFDLRESALTYAADAALKAGEHSDPEQEAARQRILARFYNL